MGYYGYGSWAPYVSVAERRAKAKKKMDALRKKGVDIQPVEIEGRKIAKTFWGEAWCDHLESFHDYENRLPRGRTYVRNGSVCHLAVSKGLIEAKVSGSELYTIKIKIKTLPAEKWEAIKARCSGQIGSLLELLQGKLSDHVMEVVTDRENGLFPQPGEMTFDCSCPDWAKMCKHVASACYGVGARLDTKPELLFLLRGVNHEELIMADAEKAVAQAATRGKSRRLAASELGDVFGIELASGASAFSQSDDTASDVEKQPLASTAESKPKRSAKKTMDRVVKKAAKKKSTKKEPANEPVKKVAKKSTKKKTVKVARRKTPKPKESAAEEAA
jgi:uncharacterized Zn finger protein